MSGNIIERIKASVTYEYMPMKVRVQLSESVSRIEELDAALRAMIYEVTHLSPMEPDGSHWCKVSADTLFAARAAVQSVKDAK